MPRRLLSFMRMRLRLRRGEVGKKSKQQKRQERNTGFFPFGYAQGQNDKRLSSLDDKRFSYRHYVRGRQGDLGVASLPCGCMILRSLRRGFRASSPVGLGWAEPDGLEDGPDRVNHDSRSLHETYSYRYVLYLSPSFGGVL